MGNQQKHDLCSLLFPRHLSHPMVWWFQWNLYTMAAYFASASWVFPSCMGCLSVLADCKTFSALARPSVPTCSNMFYFNWHQVFVHWPTLLSDPQAVSRGKKHIEQQLMNNSWRAFEAFGPRLFLMNCRMLAFRKDHKAKEDERRGRSWVKNKSERRKSLLLPIKWRPATMMSKGL